MLPQLIIGRLDHCVRQHTKTQDLCLAQRLSVACALAERRRAGTAKAVKLFTHSSLSLKYFGIFSRACRSSMMPFPQTGSDIGGNRKRGTITRACSTGNISAQAHLRCHQKLTVMFFIMGVGPRSAYPIVSPAPVEVGHNGTQVLAYA